MNPRAQRIAHLNQQTQRLQRHLNRLQSTSTRLMQFRLLAFFGAILAGLVGLAIGRSTPLGNGLGVMMSALMFLPFGLLVIRHRQVNTTINRFNLAHDLKRTHLARLALDWEQLPQRTITSPPDHPFALDLDMIGLYSVHRLLDTTITRGGSERLAGWLLTQVPDLTHIQRNQQRVCELVPLTAFRDRLTVQAAMTTHRIDGGWDDAPLLNWLEQSGTTQPIATPIMNTLFGLALLNAVLFIAFSTGILPPIWVVTFVLYALISVIQSRKVGNLFHAGLNLVERLERLQGVLAYLEDYQFAQQPHCRELCGSLHTGTTKPSRQIRRARWISSAVSLQGNPMVWLAVNAILPWDLFFANQLAQVRASLKAIIPTWLDIWYELEALSSLATFACLNPTTHFPIVNTDPQFTIRGAGHPLILAEERVTNDFTLDDVGTTVLITGSNMSGKSSFLRTLGINLQLAYCGGVVCAEQMQVGLFRVFTSIRITDSVVDGFSYFYAEVRRLKSLLDALDQSDAPPLFYLIDEIFRGTNNLERLIGSQAYIRALSGKHGMGLIATHDLELVNLEHKIAQIQNYHFREAVIAGKMVFDYRLRPGPCPTTNALKIMALVGLPVDGDDPNDNGDTKT